MDTKKRKRTSVLKKSDKSLVAKKKKLDVWKREKEWELAKKHGLDDLNFVVSGEEAGAGPLMGDCAITACVVPANVIIPGVRDSKDMNEAQREKMYDIIVAHSDIIWSCILISPSQIDATDNILTTRMNGMTTAIEEVQKKMYEKYGPDATLKLALIDGNKEPYGLSSKMNVEKVVQGDKLCACISVASVIAKVTRDRLCRDVWHKAHPEYKWNENKGYGTKSHMAAITKYGVTPYHRKTFEPLRTICGIPSKKPKKKN